MRMEWATFAVITGAAGYAFYDHHPAFGIGCLILLALYSKRGVIEDAIARITQIDFAHGKAKLKIVRDVRGDLERMITSADVSPVIKKEIFKLLGKIKLMEPALPPPQTLNRMAPLASKYITKEKAIDIVHNLPDIQAFEKSSAKVVYIANGPEPNAIPGAEHVTYMIQVAEDTPDHLATFDWVYIDAVTGAVVGRGA